MRSKVESFVQLSLLHAFLVILIACGRASDSRISENNKFRSLIDRKMAFVAGSYARGTIPAGEYAFVSKTGGYYSETVNGQILDNANFESFGYVFNHGLGDIETGGTLISLRGLREIGINGAKAMYETLTGQKDYSFSGHYRIDTDIPAGTYTLQSVGKGYVEVNKGPVGNGEILQNAIFNGSKTIEVLDGQYLKLSKVTLGHITPTSIEDPSGVVTYLRAEIRRILDGGRSEDTYLVLMLSALTVTGEELRENEPLRVISVINGFATVNGRRLPAAIVTAELLLVNRLQAKYSTMKFYYARVSDREFRMWRASLTVSGDDMDKDLEKWKASVSFEPAT